MVITGLFSIHTSYVGMRKAIPEIKCLACGFESTVLLFFLSEAILLLSGLLSCLTRFEVAEKNLKLLYQMFTCFSLSYYTYTNIFIFVLPAQNSL